MDKELNKQLAEMAVEAGRILQSPQTELIHLYYHPLEENCHHTVPIYENLLFSLALFKLKTVESMQEAKGLLEKILHFQNAEGNFPTYLHQFPHAQDPLFAAYILPVFYWILKDFSQVLGENLKKTLHAAAEKLIGALPRTDYPSHLGIRIGCSLQALGKLFQNQEWISEGKSIEETVIEKLLHSSKKTEIFIPQYLGDILISLQMIYPSIADSPWRSLWTLLIYTWHRPSLSYAGPIFKDFQEQTEPQASVYDLFLGMQMGAFSYRTSLVKPFHLQGVLIQPIYDFFPDPEYPVKIDLEDPQSKWIVFQNPYYAYSLIKSETDPYSNFFRVVWGDINCTHTFVGQNGHFDQIDFSAEEGEIEIIFTFNSPGHFQDKSKNREICFYLSDQPDLKLTVSGNPATTFQLDETVAVKAGALNIDFSFELLSGTGDFIGHIQKGNRPSQISLKGENRFAAFDRAIFLRTLRRSTACSIRLKLRLHPEKKQEGIKLSRL